MLKRVLPIMFCLAYLLLLLFAQGDIFSESFEVNPGYDTVWTENATGSSSIDPDNTDVARPTGGEDEVLKMVKAADGNCRIYNTFTTSVISYTTAYFQVDEHSLTISSEYCAVLTARDSSNAAAWDFTIINVSGTIKMRFRYFSSGALQTLYADAALTLDQWYRLDVKYDATNELWEWLLDSGAPCAGNSGSLSDAHKANIAKFHVGGTSAYAMTYYVDLINVDSSAYVTYGNGDGAGENAVFIGANFSKAQK